MGGSSALSKSAKDLAGDDALGHLQNRSDSMADPRLRALMSSYGSGQTSLADILNQAKGLHAADPHAAERSDLQSRIKSLNDQAANPFMQASTNIMNPSAAQNAGNQAKVLQQQLDQMGSAPNDDDMLSQFSDQLATDPMTGSRMASDFVQNDGLTKGLFGQGGLQDQVLGRMGADRDAVMGRDESYGLTDNDLKAYGQASGGIARQFGQQEQSLGQMLADRGLGAGNSGAAGAGFSGILGNKNEQLANMQMQIAQNRINTAKDLATFRQSADNQMAMGLGQLGQSAIQNQYGRQLSGAEKNYNQLAGTAGLNMSNQAEQQNVANEQFKQQQDSAFNPGKALAGIAGAGLSAFTGGLGTALAGGVASNLFGTGPGTSSYTPYAPGASAPGPYAPKY